MFFGKILISKLVAIDGLAPGSIVLSKIATLHHKLRDDPVKFAALVAKPILASAQLSKILTG